MRKFLERHKWQLKSHVGILAPLLSSPNRKKTDLTAACWAWGGFGANFSVDLRNTVLPLAFGSVMFALIHSQSFVTDSHGQLGNSKDRATMQPYVLWNATQ
ncbi:MAG: hypothetical protein AAF215_18675 [Cyanobacteria bacterium P01_A01_bin.123]